MLIFNYSITTGYKMPVVQELLNSNKLTMKGIKTMQQLSNNLKHNKEINYTSINKPKIQVTIKNVYGNQLIYPKCFLSMQFSKIAKTKTLSIQNLKDIKLMGFEIEIVNNDNEILSKYY